mgnify:CR=1 FL=1
MNHGKSPELDEPLRKRAAEHNGQARARGSLIYPADYRDQDLNKGSLKMMPRLYLRLIRPGVKSGIKVKILHQPYAEKSSPVLKR